MGNLKFDFEEDTVISSDEVNENFQRIEEGPQTENLISQINGIATQFSTTYNYVAGSLRVYVDGLRQFITVDYTEDGTNLFTTIFANPLEPGATLLVDYERLY